MQKVFISGPMSGIEDFNYPAFNKAAAELRALGFHVENPAENSKQESWEAYMRLALIQMLQCDVVAQLPGWAGSRGAIMEYEVAEALGIPCLPVGWLTSQYEFPGVDIDAAHNQVLSTVE